MVRIVAVMTLVTMLAGQAFADPVIYSQAPRPLDSVPVDGLIPGLYSGLLSTTFTASITPPAVSEATRVYDNFTINAPGNLLFSVTDLHFYGQYSQALDLGALVEATDFDVRFWSDNGGVPGSVLHAVTIPATPTFISNGIDPFGFGYAAYQFDADLSGSPFVGQPNTQYWLSIVANMPVDPDTGNNAWDWRFGFGDGVAFQDANFDDNVVQVGEERWTSGIEFGDPMDPPDFAFELTGQIFEPIPEPGSLAVWCTVGAVALGLALRKRRLARAKSAS